MHLFALRHDVNFNTGMQSLWRQLTARRKYCIRLRGEHSFFLFPSRFSFLGLHNPAFVQIFVSLFTIKSNSSVIKVFESEPFVLTVVFYRPLSDLNVKRNTWIKKYTYRIRNDLSSPIFRNCIVETKCFQFPVFHNIKCSS